MAARIQILNHDRTVGEISDSNPLPITVTQGGQSLSGTNPIPVSTEGTTIVVTPTVTAGAYTAGDCVGGALTFSEAARISGGGGVVKDVVVVDDAGQDVDMELWLFSAPFTSPGDNAAWAATEAELHTLVGIVALSTWYATGTPSASINECAVRYDCATTHLFGQLVTRGTPTFAATDDVTVIVGLLQD